MREPDPARHLTWLLACLLTGACGGPDERAPSLTGTYALDRAAYRRTLLPDPLPAEASAREEALERSRRELERIDVQLRLDADGTFLVRTRYDAEEGRYRGAWSRRGGTIVLRSTHTPAGPIEDAEPIEARIDGEALRFAAGVVPRPFVLRRR